VVAQQLIHSLPAFPRYITVPLGVIESFGDKLVIVLGKWSAIGEETDIDREESSPVSGVSGEEERSIRVESSVSST